MMAINHCVAAAMVWCEQSRTQRGIDQRGKAGQMRGFPARRRQRRQGRQHGQPHGVLLVLTRAAEIQDGGQARGLVPPRPDHRGHGLRAQLAIGLRQEGLARASASWNGRQDR